MADPWKSLTGLSRADPLVLDIGGCRITERFDVALASLATRKGSGKAVAMAAGQAGVPLPGPAAWIAGIPYSAFWVAPEMWFVEAPFASHEDVVAHLKPLFGETASITEQTDAWTRLDLSAPDLTPLLEHLCNVDFQVAPAGYATRTVIEHLGCYLIKHGLGEVTIYGPRSSARSLIHALEVAARALG